MDILTLVGAIAAPAVPALLGGFLTNRTTLWIALAAALAGAAGGVYVTKKFWDASEKAAVLAAANLQETRFITVIKVEKVIQDRIRVVREKAEEIIREIPVYITPAAEQACPGGVPHGFVRVHDAAARNEAAGPAAVTDAHPAGIGLAETGRVVAGNYREYHTCREQVIGWNLFYACLRAAQDPGAVDRCINAHRPQEGGG
ncbi:MAG: hypothetical protein Q8M53_10950 [Burkholderiales bacterium]|nr:hypothetical protein [Burkholderiales bacterium]